MKRFGFLSAIFSIVTFLSVPSPGHASGCTTISVDQGPHRIFSVSGNPVSMNAAGLFTATCPGGIVEYQWRTGSTILQSFSSNSSILVAPSATTVYAVDGRCTTESCVESVSVTIIAQSPLSGANLTVDPGGTLTVSNIGSSGQDGVSCESTAPGIDAAVLGIHLQNLAGHQNSGAVLNVDFEGTLGTQNQSVGSVLFTGLGPQVDVSASLAGPVTPTYEATITSNGVVVETATGHSGQNIATIPADAPISLTSRAALGPGDPYNGIDVSVVGDSGTIVIGGPGQIEQVDLGAGSGFQSADRIRLTLENPTDSINALTDALVTAGNFPSLTLGRVDLFGPLGGDGDGDGIADGRDSCPVFANTLPALDTNQDGIPDDCNCGDADGDGEITTADSNKIDQCVLGIDLTCDPDISDADGNGMLDNADVSLVQQAASGSIAAYSLTCARRPSGAPVLTAMNYVVTVANQMGSSPGLCDTSTGLCASGPNVGNPCTVDADCGSSFDVSVDPGGSLIVTNLGSSGQDGVSICLANGPAAPGDLALCDNDTVAASSIHTAGIGLQNLAGHQNPGAEIAVAFGGNCGGVSSQVVGSALFEGTGTSVDLSVALSGPSAPTYVATISNGGAPVEVVPGHTGQGIVTIPATVPLTPGPRFFGPGDPYNGIDVSIVSDTSTLVIGGPGQIEQIDLGAGSGLLSADTVTLALENPTCSIDSLSDVVVTGSNFPSLTFAQVQTAGSAIEVRAVASVANPAPGSQITVCTFLDFTGSGQLLGSYGATLDWDPSVLQYQAYSGGNPPFDSPVVNTTSAATGSLSFADAAPAGASGDAHVLCTQFSVIGALDSTSMVDLELTSLFAASTFNNLLATTSVQDDAVVVSLQCTGGDINADGFVNSGDALLVLANEIGQSIPAGSADLIAAGCGDADGDGLTDSVDSNIVLASEVGLPLDPSFPIGVSNQRSDTCPACGGVSSLVSSHTFLASAPLVSESPIRAFLAPVPDKPHKDDEFEVTVTVDLSSGALQLGSYGAALTWDARAVEYLGATGAASGQFTSPLINASEVAAGRLRFAQARPFGAGGVVELARVRFLAKRTIPRMEKIFRLEFSSLGAPWPSFRKLDHLLISDESP